MKPRIWITAILLLLLLAAATTGFVLTREPVPVAEEGRAVAKNNKAGVPSREGRVDQRSLLAARRLGLLAKTPDEILLARRAERLANHDLDLAFAEALRQIAESAPPPTDELHALQAAKAKVEADIEGNEKTLKRLNSLLPAARGAAQDRLEDQIEIAKAQLQLNRGELEEAAEELERAGGDPQAQIRRLKAAREATDSEVAVQAASVAQTLPAHSLLARFREWDHQRKKRALLIQAQQDSLTKMERFIKGQQALATEMDEDKEVRTELKAQASALATSTHASKEDSETARETMRYFAQEQRKLTALVKRTQDHRELSELYGAWLNLVAGYQRVALHGLLKALLIVLTVIATVFLLSRLAEVLISGRSKENLRVGTHRSVVKITLRSLGFLVIVFVVLGVPKQAATVFGLLGAGLTFALRDLIAGFFGWFVLMGHNGIRVGDWVEIKGVGGEVVEIGLLRTIILETGNWSDSGHPTGRRVAFVNSFATQGHYFNFSTAGQWMWDELSVLIPTGQDPYPILKGVQHLVDEETKANAEIAELEWRKATVRYRVRAFSTTPGIQVVPTALGIEIRARYITRAFQRHETRRGLYKAVVELMHGKQDEAAPMV